LTPPPPLPSWFGPRASTDDPAVAALLDQLAPARTWQDIGGDFNLNIRLDGAQRSSCVCIDNGRRAAA
jgi:hypothetical protein